MQHAKNIGGGLSPPSQHEILTRGFSLPELPSPLLDNCIRKQEISKDFLINHKSQRYKPFCTPCKKYAESVFLVAAEHVYTHVYTSPGNKVGFSFQFETNLVPRTFSQRQKYNHTLSYCKE
jgi:thiol-disulfide isomerase/thioredoxin